MDERSGGSASLEQDAEAYARQLAGFGAFTLRRFVWPDQPGEMVLDADVYRSAEPDEVEELRRQADNRTSCLAADSVATS